MISYLEEAFKDTDITYEFDNRYILLLKKNDKGRTSLIGQQSRTITGTVTDNNGEPVIGANVIIKGTSIGTVTDINGKYTLEVPPKAILQISYIGYLTKEIVIDNNKTADVILIEDTQKIDEVVVVGYGTQKKGEVASSISTIKSDNFVKTPTTDAAQLIKGKVPGLSIITPDANPTSTSQIALRGITTLKASSSPLVLIDGIPGDLNSVSPDDIEQIDVLKTVRRRDLRNQRNKRRHIDYHQECQWRNAYGSRCQCLSFHPVNHKDLAVHESRRISPTRTGRMAGSPRRRCINRLAGRSDPYTVHTDLQHQPARWQPYDQLCGQLRIPWSERPDQTYKQPDVLPACRNHSSHVQ